MNEAVEHLLNLVRIPSVSALSNGPVIDYAERVLTTAGWFTDRTSYLDSKGIEKFNLIATPHQSNAEELSPDLAFVCHTDTVPFAEDWTKALDPFVEDDVLYGCGACDVKGFLACLLTAIQDRGSGQGNPDCSVILTADEEVGCIGVSRLLEARKLRPRRVVVGEPTSLHPARAGKGYCLARVTVRGKEAHSAHPEQGQSAIYGAARALMAIETLAADLAEESNNFFRPPITTFNIGTIVGGTAKNVIPGSCSFDLEWRPLPGSNALIMLGKIRKKMLEVQTLMPGVWCEVVPVRMQDGFESSADTSLVLAIEECTRRSATSIPFGSEASIFASIADEVVVFGPGDMRSAHSSRECVSLSELGKAVECVKSLICG